MSNSWQALFLILILLSSVSLMPMAFAQNSTLTLSPLKQLKTGISTYNVICKQGFVLVIKKSDNSPACVKPDTAQKLVERGWGLSKEQLVWFEFDPIQCQPTPWSNYVPNMDRNTTHSFYLTEIGKIDFYFKEQQ